MVRLLTALLLFSLVLNCNNSEHTYADTIISNAHIYTVDDKMPWAEALAIRNGDIIARGTDDDILRDYRGEQTEIIDLDGHFAMPGFIEGHGHYHGLGKSLINLNLMDSKSWKDVTEKVAEQVSHTEPGMWIMGRGWHQEKWDSTPTRQVLGYPYHDALSAVSVDNPVILVHASGHGLIANEKAMQMAGITRETESPEGGNIVRDIAGNAIGVFEERAMGHIYKPYTAYRDSLSQEDKLAEWYRAVETAELECLKRGITSFQDAGSSLEEIARYRQLAEDKKMKLRLWAMVRHGSEVLQNNLEDYPIIDAGDRHFTCRAIKTELDGALGAFGAWLLEPYNDKPKFKGQNTTEVAEVARIAELALDKEMQVCVHAIGDRANRETLDLFSKFFKENPMDKDRRWRIEHAQHLHPADIPRFKALGVIASMQAIHCTSDAPFVVKRLGSKRAREGAYPWRSLIDAGAVVTNGTDAPVEKVNPLESFYASVTRKRADTGMEFFPEQAMTRAEAIKAYTLNNAYAAFEDDYKGSLEPGKVADIVVLNHNLLDCSDAQILETEVLYSIIDGKIVYQR